MRNSRPVDFRTFAIVGGTPRNTEGTTNAGVGLPDNCHSIQIESGSHSIKFKFTGANVIPPAFFSATTASYLPAYHSVRIHVGISSFRVGSSYLWFDRANGLSAALKLTLFMEARS
tara:strand:+ start:10 stop:357 length:348 start_codon:yes stop_codon:yes gene_type:complete